MRCIYFLALCIGTALSTPTMGQERPTELEPETRLGSRIAQKPETMDLDAARQMRKHFARCIYERHAKLADRYLVSSDPTDVDFDMLGIGSDDLHDQFSLSECLTRAMTINQSKVLMRFDQRLLRPLLAEEAYLKQNKQALSLTTDAEIYLSGRRFVSASMDTRAKALGAFADCVIYQAPAVSDAMLRAKPASSDESKAVQALVPALSACIVEGQQVSLTADTIRSLVAEGLWARSHYGSVTTGDPAKMDKAN